MKTINKTIKIILKSKYEINLKIAIGSLVSLKLIALNDLLKVHLYHFL